MCFRMGQGRRRAPPLHGPDILRHMGDGICPMLLHKFHDGAAHNGPVREGGHVRGLLRGGDAEPHGAGDVRIFRISLTIAPMSVVMAPRRR